MTSQAVYAQVIGGPPGRLLPADPIDRLLPRNREEALAIARKDHPAILAAMYDTDVAQLGTNIAESSLWPNLSGTVQRSWNTDTTLGTQAATVPPGYQRGASAGMACGSRRRQHPTPRPRPL